MLRAWLRLHDGRAEQGKKSATFATQLPETGTYEIRISYTPHPNRATNALVLIETTDGTKSLRINQRKKPTTDGPFLSLGHFQLGKHGKVTISNQGADGHVIVDAVQWLK